MKKFTAVIGTALAAILLTFGLFGCTKPVRVKVIEIPLTDEDYAFAVNKDQSAIMNAANELIAELKANDTVKRLVEKYSGSDKSDFFVYANPTGSPDPATQLVVATNAAFSPYEFVSGNKFTGVDIEIADMLAKKLGKQLYIKDGKFENVLLEVKSGNAQIGMAGLTVTEERKESVNFTDPYYKSCQVVIAQESDTTFDGCTTPEQMYEKLSALTDSVKIGFQFGTTGDFFTNNSYFDIGDTTCVMHATPKGSDDGPTAVEDLQLGRCNYVIIDLVPAKMISAQKNALINVEE